MAINLNLNHSEKDRVEAFLGALNEQFEQSTFDWKSLEESNRIVDAVKLTNFDKSLIITVIMVDTYADASVIAKANSIETRWGQNGAIMYWAESPDQDKVADVLGAFAGRE